MTDRHEKRENEGEPQPYERRQTDKFAEALGKITQKLDDHIEQNNRDFAVLRADLEPIKKFYEKARFPVTALGWAVLMLLIGILTAIGNWIFEESKRLMK
jgi:hypothetical protein